MKHHDPALLRRLAEAVGTPFWIYDAGTILRRIEEVRVMTDAPGLQARYAMKACSSRKLLQTMRNADIWIDAVSGNEVLRALHAGYAPGNQPPQICLTADVFRDNALQTVLNHGVLPNVGSPGMLAVLAGAGYTGRVSLRVNPGFGHGHVNACDTGGPSSKHGIWHEDLRDAASQARELNLQVVMLHAHIGSGPQFGELVDNLTRLAQEFQALLPEFPDIEAVSLGGGLPYNYRESSAAVPVQQLHELFRSCQERLSAAARKPLRVEIEPGRYYIASGCTLVTRVTDIKRTETNEKGAGARFAMVDAGFVDLVRPAMYGSYHRIEVVGREHATTGEREPVVVAGPLCESGDVFTRDDRELLQPRALPLPKSGDLLTIHDAGAYGYAMSSNYNSIGRAPQLWVEPDGTVHMISRRETLEDITQTECDTVLFS